VESGDDELLIGAASGDIRTHVPLTIEEAKSTTERQGKAKFWRRDDYFFITWR
jgi:hypothetical protein